MNSVVNRHRASIQTSHFILYTLGHGKIYGLTATCLTAGIGLLLSLSGSGQDRNGAKAAEIYNSNINSHERAHAYFVFKF